MAKKIKSQHQIEESPFYKLITKKQLAEILFTTPEIIKDTLNNHSTYKRRWKHKKTDEWESKEPSPSELSNYRPIDIPNHQINKYQKRIANLLSRIQSPAYLFSPVKKRSYVDNAKQHILSNAFHMLDIADYFPSCKSANIAKFFRKTMQCSPDVTAILVKITTHNDCLPQGSSSSPILAFFSNLDMWTKISKIADESNCILSVYADDITVSSENYVPQNLIWKIKKIIHNQGLTVKRDKEGCVIYKPALITGVIVANKKTKLPNKQHVALKNLKNEYNLTKDKSLESKIRGRMAQKNQIEGN